MAKGNLIKLSFAFIFALLIAKEASGQINTNYYFYEGRTQLFQGNYTEAIRWFNLIIAHNEKFEDAYFLRGYAKYELSDFKGAEADFTKAIEVNRFKSEAYYYRGIISIEKGDSKGGLKDIVNAIDIDDRHAYYFVTRGWLHLEYGDTLGAINDYRKAISINREQDNAFINLALIYMYQNNIDSAHIFCDKAIKLAPNRLGYKLTKGNIHQKDEKFTEAIEQYEWVLERDSANLRAHYFLGLCHHQLENYDQAMKAYTTILEHNYNNSSVFYNRGILYYELKDYKRALDDLNNVLKINPKNIYAYYLRGVIKIGLENYKSAEKDFDKAIDLYPKLVNAIRNRAYVKARQNNLAGAIDDEALADSLSKADAEDFGEDEIAYLKKITDFNIDFNSIEQVADSKVQYADYTIDLIPLYHIAILSNAEEFKLPAVELGGLNDLAEVLVTVDFTYEKQKVVPDKTIETIAGQLKTLKNNDNARISDILVYEALLYSWQFNFGKANEYLYNTGELDRDNFLAHFLAANNQYLLSELISSVDSREMFLNKDNKVEIKEADKPDVSMFYEMAISHYTRCIELNPDFLLAHFNRAYIYSLMKDFNKAYDDYTYCILKHKNFAEAYYNRGLLSLFLNNNDKGCEDLSKAGELGVKSAYKVMYKFCKD